VSGGSEAEQRDEMCGWRVEEGVWRKEIKSRRGMQKRSVGERCWEMEGEWQVTCDAHGCF